MLKKIKMRMGIHESVVVYDDEIMDLINDAKEDMKKSGVPPGTVEAETEPVCTAVTCYVKALFGNDRSDTERYMSIYERKVFRLALEEEDVE